MRKLDIVLGVLLISGASLLWFVLAHRFIPCETPVSYGVTELDYRLHISQKDFNEELDEAASVWNQALGKKVFVRGYTPQLQVFATYGTFESAKDDGAAGEFGQGEYVADQKGERIYIYGFTSKSDLLRALEHEFGHALGLEHVDDPQAIMYYKSTSDTSSTLTTADLKEMNRACGH